MALEGSNDVHISIIDTKRLNDRNLIVSTPSMQINADHIPRTYIHEFLAFGVISGVAHKAVVFSDLLEKNLPKLLHFANDAYRHFTMHGFQNPSIPKAVDESAVVREISKLFGKDFALRITAYLMALRDRSEEEVAIILEETSHFEVPHDWRQDPTIMTNEVDYAGFMGAERAILLLRERSTAELGRGK